MDLALVLPGPVDPADAGGHRDARLLEPLHTGVGYGEPVPHHRGPEAFAGEHLAHKPVGGHRDPSPGDYLPYKRADHVVANHVAAMRQHVLRAEVVRKPYVVSTVQLVCLRFLLRAAFRAHRRPFAA